MDRDLHRKILVQYSIANKSQILVDLQMWDTSKILKIITYYRIKRK